MKIALAQIYSKPGVIDYNLEHHLQWVKKAAHAGANWIVFPELSISGYEPTLAGELAFERKDKRLTKLQSAAEEQGIVVGVGLPVRERKGVTIGMAYFYDSGDVCWYAKQFLHADEFPYFVPGEEERTLQWSEHLIAPSICYELSVPLHAERASARGAQIYLISAVKSPEGVERAHLRCAEIARSHSLLTLLCNNIGVADGILCGGKSAAWDETGRCLGCLDSVEEAILLVDVEEKTARPIR